MEQVIEHPNHSKEYTETELLIVWKTPENELVHLIKILGRSEKALRLVFMAKNELITGQKTKMYREKGSNPEKFFENFQKLGISFVQ